MGLCSWYQVFQFAQQTFSTCLLGTTWQAHLSKYSLNMFPKHLLGDPPKKKKSTQCMLPMRTMSNVKPRQVNNWLTVDHASLWPLKKFPSWCLLALHLAPMEKSQYGILSSDVALPLQHIIVPLRDGTPNIRWYQAQSPLAWNTPRVKPNGSYQN